MSEKIELKPCPFCGEKAKLYITQKDGGYETSIICKTWSKDRECGAVIERWALKQEWAIESVIAAWNTRTPDIVRCGECRLNEDCIIQDTLVLRGKNDGYCSYGQRKEDGEK